MDTNMGIIPPRIPKYQIQDLLKQYVFNNTGIQVSAIEKIEDAPTQIRHSCLKTGVSFLPQEIFSIQSGTEMLVIPIYFCRVCGKLFMYNDF